MFYKDDDIAIIGMAGRFPEADDVNEYWKNLASGKDSVREFPETRIAELQEIISDFPIKDFSRGGYLDQTTYFEPEVFSISREESRYIDPQQRLLLELVEEAILDAGYNPQKLAGHNIGIYVSENVNHYLRFLNPSSPMAFVNTFAAVGAGRVAYTYDFTGPTLTIGTACSSSLVALHHAVRSLQSGDCEFALLGGVKLNLLPPSKSEISAVPIYSPGQKARAFDHNADGTVGGEGGGVLFLKTLQQALADGDHIHALIKGSAVNSDGKRSNGISSPSELGQADVINSALADAQIDPSSLSYLEAHGTGTKIGDPIEIAGISHALKEHGCLRQSIPIGSVKTNIGHLDGAAGVSGVIKVIQALKNKKLPPSLHFDAPNPYIDFLDTPVYVNSKLVDWETQTARRGGITSLGLTGTNAHVILEEAPSVAEASGADAEQVIVLSALTEFSLGATIKKLATQLQEQPNLAINDIAFTLNTGRRDYRQKFATTAASVEELIEKLNSYDPATTSEGSTYLRYSDKGDQTLAPVLIIPDFGDLDLTALAGLEKNPSYLAHLDELVPDNLAPDILKEEKIQYALKVYGWIKLLEDYSVKPKAILGFGLGNIVANLVTGKLTFEEGVQKLREYDKDKVNLQADKLSAFFDPIIKGGINSFIVLAPIRSLGELLTQVFADKDVSLTIQDQEISFCQMILQLLKLGLQVDWEKVYQGQDRRRVSLTGYVFNRQSYYLKAAGDANPLVPKSNSAHVKPEDRYGLLHRLAWQEEALPLEDKAELAGTWLIFHDQIGLGEELVAKLSSQADRVIQVYPADEFVKVDEDTYQMNISSADYEKLLAELTLTVSEIHGVINLWNCHQPEQHYNLQLRTLMEQKLEQEFYSTFLLNKALINTYNQVRIYQITTNAHKVGSDDSLLWPEKRMVWTLNKVLNQEVDQCTSYCIDFDLGTSSPELVCEQILTEISSNRGAILEIAYRRDQRFTQSLQTLSEDSLQPVQTVIKENGVYLVTGGTGGIGLELCKYLASGQRINLILLNRSPLTKNNSEDQKYKLALIDLLQENGTTVEMMHGNVADVAAMQDVIATIKKKYGKIDGVIHAAGVFGQVCPVTSLTIDHYQETFKSKVEGTLVLTELLMDQQLDFFVTCSSLSSEVGGYGYGAYATANAFLDSFCELQQQFGKKFLAINWGGWKEVGFAKNAHNDRVTTGLVGLTNLEGVAAFDAILNHNWHNLWVTQLPEKVKKLYESFLFFNIGEEAESGHVKPTYDLDQAGIEENLESMLRDVYVGEVFDLTDNVLDLGLDSIDVMQFVGKVKQTYNIAIPMKFFFEQATVQETFGQIRRLILGESEKEVRITPQPQQELYPVSTAQNRLYMLWQLESGGTAYNLPGVWVIEGDIDRNRVEQTVQKLINRHESLRTSFELRDQQVMQRVHPEVEFNLEYREAQDEAMETIIHEFVRPFDLRTPHLIRVGLVKLGDKHLLMMDIHHIIFDGISVSILFKEFGALYNNQVLPELKLQYRDFAVWQRELLSSEKIKSQADYWLNRFSGEIAPLNLPTDHPRPKILDYTGDVLPFTVDADLTAELNQLAKKQGVTLFMLILAAYNVLLAKYANAEDLVIGSPITGRHHSDMETMIGMFVNTLPLRNYLDKGKSFSEFLLEVKENTLLAYESQDYPLEMLVEKLQLSYDPGRNPLFDVVFNLMNQRREDEFTDLEMDGLKFTMYSSDNINAKFDLSLTGSEKNGEIYFEVEYRVSLFERATIEQLVKDLLLIMETVVSQPEIKIQEIQLHETVVDTKEVEVEEVDFDF